MSNKSAQAPKQTPKSTPARTAKVAPAPQKPAKAKVAEVHSCERVGIHARGMCKQCYRKTRLTLRKDGMTFASRDEAIAAEAAKLARKAKRAPKPLAAKQTEVAPVAPATKRVRKAAVAA